MQSCVHAHVCVSQVLNAVAIEFICKLDNELKAQFFVLLEDRNEVSPSLSLSTTVTI